MTKKKHSPQSKRSGDYAIGYARPPVYSRFKPGQSGNPRGRRKGQQSFKTTVVAVLGAGVKIIRDGKPRKISTVEAALLRVREKGLGGEPRSLDKLLQLAQIYLNEDGTVGAAQTADDADVLRIFLERLASGAASVIAPPGGPKGDSPSSSSEQPAPGQVARYRSKKI